MIDQARQEARVADLSRPWRRVLSSDRWVAYTLLMPAVILLLGVVAYPLVQVILDSFLNRSLLGSEGSRWVGLGNYRVVVQLQEFGVAALNSVAWVLSTVAMELTVGLLFALLLHGNLPGRNVLRGAALFPYVVPTVVVVLLWRYMLHDLNGVINYLLVRLGLFDRPQAFLGMPSTALPALVAIETWKHFPFVTVVLLAAMQAVPTELYEAAEVDGGNRFMQFLYITLPAIRPTLLLVMLMRLIWNAQEFDIIYMLTGGGPVNATKTLPLLIYEEAFGHWNLGTASAISVLLMVFLVAGAMLYVWASERDEVSAK